MLPGVMQACCNHSLEQFSFVVSSENEKVMLCAVNMEERDDWIRSLQDAIHSNERLQNVKDESEVVDVKERDNEKIAPQEKTEVKITYVQTSWMDYIPRKERLEDDMKNFDYDKLFTEMNPMKANRVSSTSSILNSVLKQLVATMNPSKVRLPACVLESRSLLESYGEALARPELFLAIPHGSTVEDRLLRVAAFYLSWLKCMRPIPVALKPYNPTLGEVFVCEWPTTDTTEQSQDTVRFLAEQISHHPPVSALYADSRESGLTLTASVSTISGLKLKYIAYPEALTVNIEGQARVWVKKHREHFTFDFPGAETRDVLGSNPRLETIGTTTLSCDSHGSSVHFEFSGQDHVEGKVVDSSGKTVAKLGGSWRGLVEIWEKEGEKKVLVDMRNWNKPRLPMIVAPVARQTDNESRRQWRKLTRALVHDPDNADKEKKLVEDAAREKSSQDFKPKFFHVGESNKVEFKYTRETGVRK